MAESSPQHLEWLEREDGSRWVHFKLAGAAGVAAVMPSSTQFVVSAVIEIPVSANSAAVNDVKMAVEDWLKNLGASSLVLQND
jgi:hypothetical protein